MPMFVMFYFLDSFMRKFVHIQRSHNLGEDGFHLQVANFAHIERINTGSSVFVIEYTVFKISFNGN